MKLYLLRHGQTDWNIRLQAQGVSDIELNATGIAQAEAVRDYIRQQGLEFDYVYASPLRRAAKTAAIATSGRTDIIYDNRLKERSFGELEGKDVDWTALGVDPLSLAQNSDRNGLEPIKSVLARSKSFLDDLKARHANEPDARILIASHGLLLKTLHYNIVGYDDNTDFRGFHLENCELVEYEV